MKNVLGKHSNKNKRVVPCATYFVVSTEHGSSGSELQGIEDGKFDGILLGSGEGPSDSKLLGVDDWKIDGVLLDIQA